MRRANGQVWIPVAWLGQIAEPVAVTFTEGEHLCARGFVPGDTLICDVAAYPEVGEVVAIRDHRPTPRGECNAWGGHPVEEAVAVGVYQGLEQGWSCVRVQVDGEEHQTGWDPRRCQEALIGVYRNVLGSDLRGKLREDAAVEAGEQTGPAA